MWLVTATSRAKLGLFVFRSFLSTSNCYAIRNFIFSFKKFPTKLKLVLNEKYGNRLSSRGDNDKVKTIENYKELY